VGMNIPTTPVNRTPKDMKYYINVPVSPLIGLGDIS